MRLCCNVWVYCGRAKPSDARRALPIASGSMGRRSSTCLVLSRLTWRSRRGLFLEGRRSWHLFPGDIAR
eukprot:101922-Pyramimonas_sp.AAC.1